MMKIFLVICSLCTLLGGIYGGNFWEKRLNSYPYKEMQVIPGALIGLVVGILLSSIVVFLKPPQKKEQNTLPNDSSTANNWNCPKCGKANREGALFCTNCGEKINQ